MEPAESGHRVETRLAMPRPAAEVWSRIGGFGSLRSWLPGVSECRLEDTEQGTERRVVLSDGNQMRERLEAINDAERWYRYRLIEGPGVPRGADFVSTLSVSPGDGVSCVVDWNARFSLPEGFSGREVEMLREQVLAMYETGLAYLRTRLAVTSATG